MANLLEKASIILTPTAFDDGKVLAIKPSEAPYGDFDFTRNSSATRVNAQGLVEDVQILSSNLVQNGDFSQIGSEEVSNGNFSQIGSEEVTNGDFSQEGSELVTNGDFATDSDWGKVNSTISGGKGNLDSTNGTSILFQSALVIGKTYKATLEVSNYNGLGLCALIVSTGAVQQEFTSNGVKEFYFTHGGSSTNLTFRATNGGVFSIDNVSCVEVGQDWTLGTGISIGDDEAIFTSVASGQQLSQLSLNGVSGKTYKVSYEIKSRTEGAFSASIGTTLSANQNSGVGVYTEYLTATGTGAFYIRSRGTTSGSITNISVKEIPDWTLGTGWSIGEDKAIATNVSSNTTQNLSSIDANKSYKISFNINDYSSGNFFITFGGNDNTINFNSNGDYTVYINPTNAVNNIFYLRGNSFSGSITNISVKEVAQNWNLNTVEFSLGSVFFNNVNDNIFQNKPFTVGKKYRFSFIGSGNLAYRTGYTGADGIKSPITLPYTVDIVATSNTNRIQPYGALDGSQGTLTNISVVEVTDDTNLPRINYSGFTYQDSLGSEEIVNGDFATDSDWLFGGSASISNGSANFTGSGDLIRQNATTPSGTYKVTFTVTGTGYLVVKNYTGGVLYKEYTNISQGEHTIYVEKNEDGIMFQSFGFASSIDNVSVKEYLGQEVVPDSGCGAWLFEPESTNRTPYSEDLTQNYAYTDLSITSNAASSPSGELNADKIVEGTALSAHGIRNNPNLSVTNGDDYTMSFFAKADERNYIRISNAAQSNVNALFNLSNGTIENTASLTTSNIEDYGNGWYRCSISYTCTTTIAQINISMQINNVGSTTYQGDGVSGLYLWGLTLEGENSVGYNGEYATSYIPTEGTIKTRNQDLCTNGGDASLINSSEGVLYAQISALADDNTNRYITISNGGNSYIRLTYTTTSNQLGARYYVNGTFQTALSYVLSDETEFIKVGFKWKENDFALWVNGIEVATDTSGLVNAPNTFNRLEFQRYDGVFPFFGNTKALGVWKEALTDVELRSLTYPTPTAPTFDLDFNTIATDFTFTRNSEATFVNAQGLIQSTNVISQTELITNGDFATDSDWTKGTGWTISGGKANSDGTQTSTTNLNNTLTNNLINGKTYKVVYTISDYVSGSIRIKLGNTGYGSYYSSNGTYVEYLIANVTTFDRAQFNADADFIGSIDNVSVKEYITETNTPRLDYSTGAEAFLLEPQRTNLVVNSSLGSPKTPYDGATNYLAPDGASSAFTPLVSTSSNRFESVINGGNYVSGTELTYSWYRKRISTPLDPSFLGDLDVKSFVNATFSSTTQIASDISGYDRFSVKVTITDGSLESKIRAYYGAIIGVGNSSVAYWGHQLELGSYETSLIPTSGTIVTRTQELCYDATPVINSEEGVLYAEISAFENLIPSERWITLNDGTASNVVYIYFSAVENQIVLGVITNGVTQASKQQVISDVSSFNKIAISYRKDLFKMFVNGTKIYEDTSGNAPIGLNNLDFDADFNNKTFFGNTKGLKYYPKALSDVELQDLTTI